PEDPSQPTSRPEMPVRLSAADGALLLRQRQRLRRDGGGERAGARAVALIDVGAELNDAVGRRPRGDVDPIDVDWRRQLDVEALSGPDDLVDLVAAPAGIVLQEPSDIIAHVLHAHAAGRDEAEV